MQTLGTISLSVPSLHPPHFSIAHTLLLLSFSYSHTLYSPFSFSLHCLTNLGGITSGKLLHTHVDDFKWFFNTRIKYQCILLHASFCQCQKMHVFASIPPLEPASSTMLSSAGIVLQLNSSSSSSLFYRVSKVEARYVLYNFFLPRLCFLLV